jgi:hypothetical protein
MERLSRLGFFSGLSMGAMIMGVIWLGESGAFNTASGPLSVGYNDIASIRLQAVPEGPPGPLFTPRPRLVGDQPLAVIRDLVPDPLPRPSEQPVNCPGGGDLVVGLKSGGEITYGPCRWPWQISQLWGAIIEASDLTATDPIRPNTAAAAADLQRVRQALAVAIERDQAPRKPRYGPRTVSCQPTPTPRPAPFGYRCAVVLHSETGPARVKHLVVCAAISAGRMTYKLAPVHGACPPSP